MTYIANWKTQVKAQSRLIVWTDFKDLKGCLMTYIDTLTNMVNVGFSIGKITCDIVYLLFIVFRAYSMLEEAAFVHNFTKAQELVALAYLVCFELSR